MSTPVIGVTGSIGSGKTTFSKFLAEQGGRHLDADKMAHELMLPGHDAYEAVLDEFGTYITDEEGYINPSLLADEVFSDSKKLKRLEDIIHPLVFEKIKQIVSRPRESFYVVDAPLLFEAGVDRLCHWIVCVTASEEVVNRRVRIPEAELDRRRRRQLSAEEKCERADEIVDNSGSLDHLQLKAEEVAHKLQPGGELFEAAEPR